MLNLNPIKYILKEIIDALKLFIIILLLLIYSNKFLYHKQSSYIHYITTFKAICINICIKCIIELIHYYNYHE